MRTVLATLERGVELRVIQDLLGHRHITATRRYAHVALNIWITIRVLSMSLALSATTSETRKPAA